MPAIAEPLRRVLDVTGYFNGGRPAASTVQVCNGQDQRRRRTFHPDVEWRGQNGLNVYFKFAENPTNKQVGAWQQEVWNEGSVPLLWLVSTAKTDLYNGFALPQEAAGAAKNRLDAFHHAPSEPHGENANGRLGLADLNARAGRLAMETGHFWQQESRVDRKSSVDRRLLKDMAALERILSNAGLSASKAQALIGRSVFAKYLTDRGIITEDILLTEFDSHALQDVFRDADAAGRLFKWLSTEFNGDMFSPEDSAPNTSHLKRVADFLDGHSLATGQKSLFPYCFDLIPVELISAIYEQFVHSAAAAKLQSAATTDVHYTPLAAVSLVLDEAMQGFSGNETVLDLTCGSGVFLVEAMRRLVALKAAGEPPTRAMIRKVLHKQIHGVDISPDAIRIAAFSLYLSALELDPNPCLAGRLKFGPLIGENLLIGDAYGIENTPEGKTALADKTGLKRFDVILGNPPWSHQGSAKTLGLLAKPQEKSQPPRGVSLNFVERAKDFAHENTRFGVLVSATHFFSRGSKGRKAVQRLVESLSPLTLINLSEHASWLFPRANMPAMALIGRNGDHHPDRMRTVRVPWSQASGRSHFLGMMGSDVNTLPLSSWRRNSDLMKAAFFGKLHDHLLLDRLFETQRPLEKRLAKIGSALKMGLTPKGKKETSSFLQGLPYLEQGLRHFAMPRELPEFNQERVERARNRKIYRAPLVIAHRHLVNAPEGPRLAVSISKKDIVFRNDHYGASFQQPHANVAPLLAGILSSSLASWYFLMAGAMFGLWQKVSYVYLSDVNALPAPDLEGAAATKTGLDVKHLVERLQSKGMPPHSHDWRILDESVLDLYGMEDDEKAVVRDGLLRAGWQWKEGRQASAEPAELVHLKDYAEFFAAKIDPWFHAANERRLRAEIHDSPASDPLRLVRFSLERHPPPSVVRVVRSRQSTYDVLMQISKRMNVSVEGDLSRFGELRLTDRNEVVIVKPAARRNWLAVNAFSDARAVLEESFEGGGPG